MIDLATREVQVIPTIWLSLIWLSAIAISLSGHRYLAIGYRDRAIGSRSGDRAIGRSGDRDRAVGRSRSGDR
jgi:hypothetical protein